MKSTTVLYVQKKDKAFLIADGQVTLGDMVCKSNANKIRRIGKNKNVVVGFAGSVADCLTLTSRLEAKLEEFSNDVVRSVIELSKDWRSDKYLKSLEAQIIIADKKNALLVGGNGEVIEIDNNVASVGSGSKFALSAATALIDIDSISAEDVARKSMKIAAQMCVYTNDKIVIEEV